MKKVLKKLLLVFGVFLMLFGMTACFDNFNNNGNKETKTPTLTFKELEVELNVGEQYTLNPVITELSGTDLVKYVIDETDLISISGNTVTALKAGNATIHASLKEYDDISVDISIVITARPAKRVKAKISEDLQGNYFSTDITVTVYESKILVDLEEEAIEFDLYKDDNGVYILDEVDNVEIKIYISFASDGKTISAEGKGTFTKDPILADVSDNIGTYADVDTIIEVAKDSLKITKIVTGEETSYSIYVNKDGYYIINASDNGKEVYLRFNNNTLSIFDNSYEKINEIVLDNAGQITSDKTGEYFAMYNGKKAIINEYSIVYDSNTNATSSKLYQDNKGIYFFIKNENSLSKAYIEFNENRITILDYLYFKSDKVQSVRFDDNTKGEYYKGNDQIVVAGGYIQIKTASGTNKTLFIYSDSKGMFYVDNDNSLQYITITANGITTKDGTFIKKYIPEESISGFYYSTEMTIYIGDSNIMIFPTPNEKITYNLFKDADGIYYNENGKKEYLTFTSIGFTCNYGEFADQASATGHSASIPEVDTGEYTDGKIKYQVERSGIYIRKNENTLTYAVLFENVLGIYYYDGETSTNIYCQIKDGYLINKFGTFKQKPVYVGTAIDEKYCGTYITTDLSIVLDINSLDYIDASHTEKLPLALNRNQELVVVMNENEYALTLFDDKIKLDCAELNVHYELNKKKEEQADYTIDLNDYNSSDKNALANLTPDIIVLNGEFKEKEKYKIVNSSNSAFDTKEYELNTNLFTNINSAITAASDNDNIYVFSGTYTGAVNINKNNVNLLGANYNYTYNDSNRGKAETKLEGVVINISKEISNITIKGFKFVGEAKIVNEKGTVGTDSAITNIENFNFINNIVNTSLNNASFITFSESKLSYSKNISIIGNAFTNLYSIENMIKFDNNNGLTIKNNEFMDIDGNAIYIIDTTKGLAGNLDLENNVFSNITGSAFFANWYSPLPNTNPSLLVKGNIFESVYGGACVDFEQCNNADASLYSSFKVEENIFKDVFKCFYKYNSTNVEFKHNIVYQYATIPTSGYVVSLNSNAVDVSENLYLSNNGANVITSVYSSSTSDNNGFRFSASIDKTNTNGNNYSSKSTFNDANYAVKTFTYDGKFSAEYDTNSYVGIGASIELVATFTNVNSSNLVFESLDESIASVSGTTVTGISAGIVAIRCYLNNQKSTHVTFVVAVLENELSDVVNFILDSHNSNIHITKNLKVDGNAPFYIDAIGSVSDALFGDPLTIDTSYEAVQEANTNSNHGGTKSSTEFITVHYTASNGSSAGAKSHASYFANNTSTSIHYTTGNDGVYHILNDSLIAYHAGDGTRGMTWTKTGVKYQESDPKYPTFGISSDSYFTINGKKTTIAVPTGETELTKKVTDSRFINDMGLPFKIVNGEYYMGRTWWCYTQVAEGRICSTGGNANSIGIETSVNKGSDLWLTWHKTAQLVAKLMQDYNLDITRVVGHHFYSAKNCPQPLLENDLELWWKFIEMVEAEYSMLTNYSNYEFSLNVINSNGILADNGRINNLPNTAKSVLYELVITNKSNGVKQSIVLSSLINPNK